MNFFWFILLGISSGFWISRLICFFQTCKVLSLFLNIFSSPAAFYSFCYPGITNVKSLVLIQQILDVLYMYYFLCSSLENFYSVFSITDSLFYPLYFIYNPLHWGFVFVFFSSKISVNIFLISTMFSSFLMMLLIFCLEFVLFFICS